MSDEIQHEFIELFKFLFKGREDVFAIRWVKGNKSGYMPAYFFDPYMYRAHKISGGTFQNYTDKKYLPLTEIELEKHLNGEQLIGIHYSSVAHLSTQFKKVSGLTLPFF